MRRRAECLNTGIVIIDCYGVMMMIMHALCAGFGGPTSFSPPEKLLPRFLRTAAPQVINKKYHTPSIDECYSDTTIDLLLVRILDSYTRLIAKYFLVAIYLEPVGDEYILIAAFSYSSCECAYSIYTSKYVPYTVRILGVKYSEVSIICIPKKSTKEHVRRMYILRSTGTRNLSFSMGA